MNINIQGFCIEPEEIESVLRNYPVVDEAIVMFDKGKYAERLVAWIVRKPETDVDISEICQHLKKSLPAHMIPAFFIFTKQLPLDATGKIDRRALSFDAMERSSDGNYESPRNLLENIVADIWKTTLGQEKIGIHDDFLDLGCDSIQAGLISLKIQECFNVEIPLIMFFEDLNVEKLAEKIYRTQEDSD